MRDRVFFVDDAVNVFVEMPERDLNVMLNGYVGVIGKLSY